MKAKKIILLSSITALTLLISGCGDSATTSNTTPDTSTEATSNIVTVERGPLLGATVVDANGSVAVEIGGGQYSFQNTIVYPITSTGGYIDINRNSQVDAGEVENTLILKSTEGNVVTLATTMASNEQLKEYLVDTMHIDEDALHEKTPGNHEEIEALSDEMFKYAHEHNIIDLSTLDVEQMELIKDDYESRYNEYHNDDLKPQEHEQNLIEHEMHITVMDDADVEEIHLEMEKEKETHQDIVGNVEDHQNTMDTSNMDEIHEGIVDNINIEDHKDEIKHGNDNN